MGIGLYIYTHFTLSIVCARNTLFIHVYILIDRKGIVLWISKGETVETANVVVKFTPGDSGHSEASGFL